MTQAQSIASNPEHSVWVAASAGTGKTKVLTDRVLRLLLSGVAPGKILCLTFTTAAATEMASRIQKRLGEWVTLPEQELSSQLEHLTGTKPLPALLTQVRTLFAEVLESPEGMSIQTIHAFCQSLISRFPLEAGISPHSQIIDDVTAKELLQEARLRLLRGRYDKKDRNADAAISAISWRLAEAGFAELMEEIVNKSTAFSQLFQQHSLPELERKTYATLGAILGVTSDTIVKNACTVPNSDDLKRLAHAWLNGTDTEVNRGDTLTHWLSLSIDDRIKAYSSYHLLFFNKSDGEPAKKLLNKGSLANYPDAEAIALNEQERLLRIEEQRKSQLCAELSSHVLHIAECLLAIYRDLKDQRGFLDYNDLISKATDLIQNPNYNDWILFKLDGGIDHILVDEAQDTSPAQWDIVKALCTEFFSGDSGRDIQRSLFVVGDEKQSIYSFQGADPRKFHDMQTYFSARASEATQSWQQIPLGLSFRSTEAVLQCVDAVFASADLKKAISTSGVIEHSAHRKGQAGLVEVWAPFSAPEKEPLEPWPLPSQRSISVSASTMLADKIAGTIAEWLRTKRLLISKNRPVTAGDILILVRRRNAFVGDMVRALKKRHIPVSGADRMMLLEHIAIMDLLALGKFLLLPQDDLNLATVLKTPLIGLSEEDLFTLAYNREGSLWDSLKQKQTSFQPAYNYLSGLLKHTDFDTPFALFTEILEIRDGRKAFISRLGHEVNDALDEFLSLSLTYQQCYTPSLQGFLHWLETTQVEIKRDMEQGTDQVRIMTVHGSKGLQAPIVFLPDTMQTPQRKETLIWTDGLVFWPGKSENRNAFCKTRHEEHKRHEMDEYYRLLYVALTRPEDELYICGHYENKKPSDKSWYCIISAGLVPIAEKTGNKESGEVILRLSTPQEILQPEYIPHIKNPTHAPLPAYFLTSAPQESVLVKRSVSRGEATYSPLSPQHRAAALRGTLIHRLLELLPNIPASQRKTKAETFLASYQNDFPTGMFETALANITGILENPEFAFLFSDNSQAEIALTGNIDGQRVNGQIDRLIVTDTEVWIIDYKTSPTPPAPSDIPHNYREQLTLYKTLVAPLYSEKTIRCALLWTATLALVEVHD